MEPLVKRKRALLESNLPRNNWLRLSGVKLTFRSYCGRFDCRPSELESQRLGVGPDSKNTKSAVHGCAGFVIVFVVG
jgi:hypothetical protein